MEATLVIFAIVVSSTVAEVSETNCQMSDQLVESLVARGVRRTSNWRIYTSGLNSVCFHDESTKASCCSDSMENALKEEAEMLLRQQIETFMGTLQENVRSHIEEFNQFVTDGIEFVRQNTLIFLNRTGSINEGMVNEMETLFSNMVAYFTDGEISREEIAGKFLDSIYAEMVFQKYRRNSPKFYTCVKGVIERNDRYFFKLHKDYLESIINPYLLDARAYSQGLEKLHDVFDRLARLTVTETCKEDYFRSSLCSYCKGHGDELPTCFVTCLNVFKDCTQLHQGLFFRRWESYVEAMRFIAENMILIPYTFTKIAPATANAIRDFNFLLISTHHDVVETCGKPRRSKLYGFIGELEDRPLLDTDFYIYARDLNKIEELGNITEKFINPGVLTCEDSTTYPCWTGTNLEHNRETPVEVLEEARTFKKLAFLLKRVSLERWDPFQPEKGGRLDAGKNTGNDESEEASGQEPQEYCPNQWSHYQSSCYFSTTSMSFNLAREKCRERGGDLVSIQSLEENDLIKSLVDNQKAWIGATKDQGGQFSWLDMSEWTTSVIVIDTDELPNDENCVEINNVGPGILSTLACEDQRIGICEVPL
ncbi:Glypican-6 [Holothuria leucospilota]|uniref:Glypican-6 n=1 Tax=Holothuria leucospilota TaxID=206669 RepID=A0A9Q0YG20_HOLLE|nr:Glypican-6 [Holothuria leucospilota]